MVEKVEPGYKQDMFFRYYLHNIKHMQRVAQLKQKLKNCYYYHFYQDDSVAHFHLKFSMELRITLNFRFYCLYFLSPGIAGVQHEAQFNHCWRWNPMIPMCQASNLPATFPTLKSCKVVLLISIKPKVLYKREHYISSSFFFSSEIYNNAAGCFEI